MHHAGGHGEGGDSRSTDHGVDLLLGEEIDQLGKQHAACGVYHEGDKPQS